MPRRRRNVGKLQNGEISARLRFIARRVRSLDLLLGVLILAAFSVAWFFGLVLLDHAFILNSTFRRVALTIFEIAAIAGAAGTAWAFLFRPVNLFYVARLIENANPALKNSLISYLQCERENSAPPDMLALMRGQLSLRLASIDWRELVNPKRCVRAAFAMAICLAVFLAYGMLSEKSALVSLRRALMPSADILPPTETQLVNIRPGDTDVLKGDPLDVYAGVSGKVPDQVVLHYSSGGDGGEEQIHEMLRSPAGDWHARIPMVLKPLSYFITAGDTRSERFDCSVSVKPLVTGIEIGVAPPEYTGIAPYSVNTGSVKAPYGSRLSLKAAVNQPALEGWAIFEQAPKLNLKVEGDGTLLTAEFPLLRRDAYSVHFIEQGGKRNLQPVRHELEPIPDEPPKVEIQSPPDGTAVSPQKPFDLAFRAVDDYGIQKARLRYVVNNEDARFMNLELPEKKREDVKFRKPMRAIDLGGAVGDTIAYRIEVEDGFPDKPHVVQSDERKIIVMDEDKLASAQKEQQENAQQQQSEKQQENGQQQQKEGSAESGEGQKQEGSEGAGKPSEGEGKAGEQQTADGKGQAGEKEGGKGSSSEQNPAGGEEDGKVAEGPSPEGMTQQDREKLERLQDAMNRKQERDGGKSEGGESAQSQASEKYDAGKRGGDTQDAVGQGQDGQRQEGDSRQKGGQVAEGKSGEGESKTAAKERAGAERQDGQSAGQERQEQAGAEQRRGEESSGEQISEKSDAQESGKQSESRGEQVSQTAENKQGEGAPDAKAGGGSGESASGGKNKSDGKAGIERAGDSAAGGGANRGGGSESTQEKPGDSSMPGAIAGGRKENGEKTGDAGSEGSRSVPGQTSSGREGQAGASGGQSGNSKAGNETASGGGEQGKEAVGVKPGGEGQGREQKRAAIAKEAKEGGDKEGAAAGQPDKGDKPEKGADGVMKPGEIGEKSARAYQKAADAMKQNEEGSAQDQSGDAAGQPASGNEGGRQGGGAQKPSGTLKPGDNAAGGAPAGGMGEGKRDQNSSSGVSEKMAGEGKESDSGGGGPGRKDPFGSNDAAARGRGRDETIDDANRVRGMINKLREQMNSGKLDKEFYKDAGMTEKEFRDFVTKYDGSARAKPPSIPEPTSSPEEISEKSEKPAFLAPGVKAGKGAVGEKVGRGTGASDAGKKDAIQSRFEAAEETISPEYRDLVREYYIRLSKGEGSDKEE
ncbi:MAG TPA: DUF4175 family protein [Candidatus Brocadiia bacterium]|nr:DUF4175 family protein [Candidatus Brocadiia bacterium]